MDIYPLISGDSISRTINIIWVFNIIIIIFFLLRGLDLKIVLFVIWLQNETHLQVSLK